jgi:hypothetical protein
MRGITRSMAVVCLLLVPVVVFGSPREGRGDIVKRIVKKIRALGDGLTVPGTSPAPTAPKP